jgi:undecaprenyl-diphosphatase
MVFGASLDLAARVAGRLAAVLLVLLAMSWLTLWLSRRLYTYFRLRAHRFILLSFDLCKAHPGLGQLATPLIEPNRRDYPGLLAWALILSTTGLVASALVPANSLAVSLEGWRNPLADHVLAVGQDLGESSAVLMFSGVVAAWLLFRRRRMALAHLLMGVGFTVGLGTLGATLFALPLLDGPVLNGVATYGFTAVLLAGCVPIGGRWLVYGMAALLALSIAFARLYFGEGQLLGIGVSLIVAVIWLILLGVAYRRHSQAEASVDDLVWLAPLILAVMVVLLWHTHSMAEFRYHAPPATVSEQEWLDRGWSRLPAQRAQNFGWPSELLAVQWAAPLEDIRVTLLQREWREAKPLALETALRVLNPDADVAELPVLPHFNRADADRLRLIKPTRDGRWLIVRFWPSGFELTERSVPIWVGRVAFLKSHELLGLLKLLDETGDDSEALSLFTTELQSYLPAIARSRGEAIQTLLVPPHQP